MAIIKFVKMVAAGNDFILLDDKDGRASSAIGDVSAFAKKVCARKLSVGADGVLLLQSSRGADLRMRIFNPDGSEVSMCGNGARCAAVYAAASKWCPSSFVMETGAGLLEAEVKGSVVKLRMTDPTGIEPDKKIIVDKKEIRVHYINTGVPHAVCFTDELEGYPVFETGRAIRRNGAFAPEGTNADFVKVTGPGAVSVRTYERGVEDETLACGTGAVASAVAAALAGRVKPPVSVLTKSGETLKVYFTAAGRTVKDVYLEGPALAVYEGGIEHV